MFGGGATKEPRPNPPTPTKSDAEVQQEAAEKREKIQLKSATRGKGSTKLTGKKFTPFNFAPKAAGSASGRSGASQYYWGY